MRHFVRLCEDKLRPSHMPKRQFGRIVCAMLYDRPPPELINYAGEGWRQRQRSDRDGEVFWYYTREDHARS